MEDKTLCTIIMVATELEFDLGRRYLIENRLMPNSNNSDFPSFLCCKTGVGRTNVSRAFAIIVEGLSKKQKLDDCKIINIGLCGSSVKGSKVYDLIKPVNFIDGDRDHECEFTKNDLYPEVIGLDGPTLVSSSKFVTNPTQEAYYDMEAFELQSLCKEFEIDFICYKIVSDLCNIDSYEKVNKDKLYLKFKEALDECRRNI